MGHRAPPHVEVVAEELRQRMRELKAQIPWLRVFVEGVERD